MKNVFAVIVIFVLISLFVMWFSLFASIMLILILGHLIAWAFGMPINVSVTKDDITEKRVYRWLTRIK